MDREVTGPAGVCPTVEAAFSLLGKKWTGLIVHELLGGRRYFRELERAIPELSARVLTVRIKELEEEGLLLREVEQGSPVRVAYALTPKGRALEPVLRGIETWAHAWATEAERPS